MNTSTEEQIKTKVPTGVAVLIVSAVLFGVAGSAAILMNAGVPKANKKTSPSTTTTNTSKTTNTNTTPTSTSVGMFREMWISQAEVDALSGSGQLWDFMQTEADQTNLTGTRVPAVCGASTTHDTYALAAALVWAKTQDPVYRTRAANAIDAAIGTEDTSPCPLAIVGSAHQGLVRNGAAYVIAADIINLPNYDTSYGTTINNRFVTWITGWRTRVYGTGNTNLQWMEQREDNQGFYAGAVLAAADAYLGDFTGPAGLNHVHQVFKGAVGDLTSWTWSSSSNWATFAPDGYPLRPINPAGAVKQGYNVDGYAVVEWGRCGDFTPPPLGPCYTTYIWGDEGLLAQAEILENMGYGDVFAYQQNALKRMIDAMHRQFTAGRTEFWTRAQGDMNWQIFYTNYAYGTSYPETMSPQVGNMMGWAWQFEGRTRTATPSSGSGGLVCGSDQGLPPCPQETQ